MQREVISAEERQDRSFWGRTFPRLPYISKRMVRDTRRIEVVVDAHPTAEELQEMLDTYHERYGTAGDVWSNLGFRKDGSGRTYWLNELVVKTILHVPDLNRNTDESGHYTTERLFTALHLNRHRILAPFATIEAQTATEPAVLPEQVSSAENVLAMES